MTPAQILSWATLALSCAITFSRGRGPERLGMAIVAAGYIATPMVQRLDSWYAPQFGMLSVDLVMLAAFVWLTFRYSRSWAIWAAAFQAIAVLTHFAFMIAPHLLYRAYYAGNYSIGYLILGAILGGVVFESATPPRRRRGHRRSGPASASRPSED